MKLKLLAFAGLVYAFSCQPNENYEKTGDTIVVTPRDSQTKKIKLQVLSDKIIRVTATANDDFSEDTSLVVLRPASTFNEWESEEKDGLITITTASLKATVSVTSGEVSFYDLSGNLLLQEQENGGKSFTPVDTDPDHFSIRQVFESPDDEAFYGLGQHQNRQMNLKGEDVELAQHNIVAVVPFLYSNKNYGILWDNYSITRFGDPRPYKTNTTLQLFDADGKPGGLTARYFSNNNLVSEEKVTEINHQYLEDTPTPPNYEMPNAKVEYEGSFSSDVEGAHKFKLYASGYMKLWIDDELVMDKWRQGWNPWYNNFTVDMKAGEQHKIKIEWDLAGAPYLALKHLDPQPQEEQNKLSLFSEVAEQIDYYFIAGNNADEVISGYRYLSGKAPIMPKWVMGFWQSRERYRNQEQLLDVVREYRKREIPIDNIVLDWQYWEDPSWGSHEFDSTRFPDAKGMVDELHNELNTRIMISVWPKFNTGTENFKAMHENGYLFQRNLDKKRKDWVGPGYESTFYDPFNPGARQMFWDQLNENLFRIGIDAWWLDATEPDMHSNLSVEERKLNMTPTYLGSGAKYFNAYSLMNSKGIYEKQRETDPNKRVFILTRSAFAGQQRYSAATWSGDIVTRWSDLADQIPAGLGLSIAGIPYWTHDIGGFSVEPRYENPNAADLEEWRELQVRWFQFGTFSPLFRVHGQFPVREIFNLAPENHPAYKTMVTYNKLRYRLMPYIYTLAGKTYHDDYTIMRSLIMDYGDDKNVLEIDDQYMFGPSILVAPVVAYKARNRDVYLPNGNGWYDFYSGAYYHGASKITIDAPLERIPLFVKEGTILTFGPEISYTMESIDPLTVYVFTGADGSFSLYEDEGINYNYENGKFSNIPFTYTETEKTLKIGTRDGSYEGMPETRTIHVVWVNKDAQTGVDFQKAPSTTVEYNGTEQMIKMNN